MAEIDEALDDGAGKAAAHGAAKPAKRGRKRLIVVAIAATTLVGGAGAVYATMRGAGGDGGAAATAATAVDADQDPASFVDVPPMIVNLRSADGAARFIKLHFMLVPGRATTADALKAKLPLLLDAYQPFLRELRPEDLAGSAAVFRLKEEMMVRAHDTLGNGVVKDVLIEDLIQQ